MTPAAVPPAAADPLAALRGLHLPEPVGAWPPAPGWWILAGLVAAATLALWAWSRARRRSVARHALRELERLAGERDALDLPALATAVSSLLRRLALVRFGRARVAALHGEAWRAFLSSTGPRKAGAQLAGDAGLLLSLAPYAPAGAACLTLAGATVDRAGLITAARAWIRENA